MFDNYVFVHPLFAETTKRTYRTQMSSYLAFCHYMGYRAVPAAPDTIYRYAAMLARTFKFSSIKQYLNVVRILHLEWGLPDPLCNHYSLTAVLKGIQRALASPVSRKVPVTPPILLRVLSKLDLTTSRDSSVWAAALMMFHGMFRRSNVLPVALSTFDPQKHLRRRDIAIYSDRLVIRIRWSTTIQYRQRCLALPLFRLRDSPLCPVQAIVHSLSHTPNAALDGPALVYHTKSSCTSLRPLTSAVFISIFHQCLRALEMDPSTFGTHSFRRGGASHAFQAGLSVDSIRQIGDWKSNAYSAYVLHSDSSLQSAMQAFSDSLRSYSLP